MSQRRFAAVLLPAHKRVVIPPGLSSLVNDYRLKRWECKEGDAITPQSVLCSLTTQKKDNFQFKPSLSSSLDDMNSNNMFLAKRLVKNKTSNLREGNVIAVLVDSEAAVREFARCTFADFNPDYQPPVVVDDDKQQIRLPRTVGEHLVKLASQLWPSSSSSSSLLTLKDFDNPIDNRIDCKHIIDHINQQSGVPQLDSKSVRDLLYYLFVWADMPKEHRALLSVLGGQVHKEIASRHLSSFTNTDLCQALDLFRVLQVPQEEDGFVRKMLEEMSFYRNANSLSAKELAMLTKAKKAAAVVL